MEWARTPLGREPRWTAEPDIEIVEQLAHTHLSDINEVSFFAAGAFNKLYLIDSNKGRFLMRVTMPVYTKHKTLSEVSTLMWVRQKTKIPVPNVIAFDDSRDNLLGFEWILMEMMSGKSLYNRWRTMPMEAKNRVVKEVAGYQAELLRWNNEFRSIGNIYRTADTTNRLQSETEADQRVEAGSFEVGRMVALEFFWGDRIDKTIPRGPFRNGYEWLKTRLDLAISEQQALLEEADDEDDKEEAEDALWLGERLSTLLPKVLAPSHVDAEPIVLWHGDLSQSNVLLNDNYEITAILDWECVSVLPAWVATKVPRFLQSRIRPQLPNREEYSKEEDDYKGPDGSVESSLDNEGVSNRYWEALLEHEQTILRPIYWAEMERLQPEFEVRRERYRAESSLHYAILYFTNWLSMKRVDEWLDGMEEGKCQDLWQGEEVEVFD